MFGPELKLNHIDIIEHDIRKHKSTHNCITSTFQNLLLTVVQVEIEAIQAKLARDGCGANSFNKWIVKCILRLDWI